MRSLFSIPVFNKEAGAGAASSANIPNASANIHDDTKLQPGVYWVLTSNIATDAGKEIVTGGAFDLYIVESNGDIFRIKQPGGEKELIQDKEIERALSQPKNITYSQDREKKFTIKQISSGELTQEERRIIAQAHNCFGGHDLGTCGWTTLASTIALLAYKFDKNNVSNYGNDEPLTIQITGFEGKLTLQSGSEKDFDNRRALAEWLEKNEGLLKELAPSLNNEGPESFFERIKTISQLKEIKGISGWLDQGVFGGVDALKDLTLDKILKAKVAIERQKLAEEGKAYKENLEKQYQEKRELLAQSGMKINWENITIEDVAILTLLSAFLAVISGPGALAIPVVIAACRAISIEKGLNLEGKVDFSAPTLDPKPSSSDSKAQQLVDQKTAVLSAAGAA